MAHIPGNHSSRWQGPEGARRLDDVPLLEEGQVIANQPESRPPSPLIRLLEWEEVPSAKQCPPHDQRIGKADNLAVPIGIRQPVEDMAHGVEARPLLAVRADHDPR